MNPNFVRSRSDKNAVRAEYIKNLQLETSNNLLNYNANQLFKQTGVLPPSITSMIDTRSITEKYADIQKARVAVISGLREITDGANANEITDNIHGHDIIALANNLPAIIADLKPKWSLGIPAPAFLAYWNNYTQALRLNNGTASIPVIQSNQLLNNIQAILMNIQSTLPSKEAYSRIQQIINLLPKTTKSAIAVKIIEEARKEAETIRAEANAIAEERIRDPIEVQRKMEMLGQLLERQASASDIAQATDELQISQSLGGSAQNTAVDNVISLINPSTMPTRRKRLILEESESEGETPVGITAEMEQQVKSKMSPSGSPPSARSSAETELGTPFSNAPSTSVSSMITQAQSQEQEEVEGYIPQSFEEYQGLLPSGPNGQLAVARRILSKRKNPELSRQLETKFGASLKPSELNTISKYENSNAEVLIEKYYQNRPPQGKGVRPRYILGKGVGSCPPVSRTFRPTTELSKNGKYKPPAPKVDTSKKVEKVPPYIQFGKHLIHIQHLEGGKLQIRRPKGSALASLPSQSIGGRLKKVLISLTGSSSPTFEEINELSDHDKKLLNTIVKECKIDQRLLVPTPDRSKEEQDYNRLQILTGEINAGNNSPQLVKELKVLLLRLKNCRRIPLRHYNEIMSDLLSLGY